MRRDRLIAIVSSVGAAALLLAAAAGLWQAALGQAGRPFSTPIGLVADPSVAPASPAELPAPGEPADGTVRLGFVGDIMQHRAQRNADFAASYAAVAPLLRNLDFVVGNLEFPVDASRPVGPPPRSVRFNGSPAHLDALARAGFDALVTANNHSADQGAAGLQATRAALAARGLIPLGSAERLAELAPRVVRVGDIAVGFVAYTMAPNAYIGADGRTPDWPDRALPVAELYFAGWQGAYRQEGLDWFAAHRTAAEAHGAQFLVAFVHWGEEWHFQPTPDQRRAARDMIDAGFDLVIGSHAHVLNGPEIYRGRLIAYSMGNFVADFAPLEARTTALLELSLARARDGTAALTGFCYRPLLIDRDGHRVIPLRPGLPGDRAQALALARRVLGDGVRPIGSPCSQR